MSGWWHLSLLWDFISSGFSQLVHGIRFGCISYSEIFTFKVFLRILWRIIYWDLKGLWLRETRLINMVNFFYWPKVTQIEQNNGMALQLWLFIVISDSNTCKTWKLIHTFSPLFVDLIKSAWSHATWFIPLSHKRSLPLHRTRLKSVQKSGFLPAGYRMVGLFVQGYQWYQWLP